MPKCPCPQQLREGREVSPERCVEPLILTFWNIVERPCTSWCKNENVRYSKRAHERR